MAVYENTKMAAISLPFGANHLPLEALPWLEKYERIYLWTDADEVGRIASEKFAQKLGLKRTFIVNTTRDDPKGPKDANDALRAGHDLLKYIKEARPLTQENILTFKQIKAEVIKRIINYESNKGVLSSFDWFNKKIKGFRKGELTVLTGGTGSGKTTLLSQMSLDFMERGVPTLWGSFEIRNEVLASTMLMQFARKNLIEDPKSIDLFARDFESLPLYFLKFYGSTPIDEMLNTLDYAVYAYDISHIIIDNLQFMLSGQAKGYDKFDLQDILISKLRDFATNNKIHITLVIHPKKVDEDTQDLSVSSIFGTAKATQEADNVFILQNRYKYRLVDIRKNRFDGEIGRFGLGYDRNTKRFLELTENEVNDLNKTQKTLEDIFAARATAAASNVEIPEIELNKMKSMIGTQIKKIEKIVEQDIAYYGNIAQKTTNKIKNIVNQASPINLKTPNKTNYEENCEESFEYGMDECQYQNQNNDEIKKIISKLAIKSNDNKTPGKIPEQKQENKPKIGETPKAFVEPKIPNKIITNPPETELLIKEGIKEKQKEEIKKPNLLIPSIKPKEMNIQKNSNEPELKAIGVPDWISDLPKMPEKVNKSASKQTVNKSQKAEYKKSYKSESQRDKKPSFGETYSSVSKSERKKLFEVLQTNGYLTTKSKGKYGRSTGSSGKSSDSSDRL